MPIIRTVALKDLYGGTQSWNPASWTAVDDRVRGGSSQSYLSLEAADECICSQDQARTARFYGTLDINTLGGAGFASRKISLSSRLSRHQDGSCARDPDACQGTPYLDVKSASVDESSPESETTKPCLRERNTVADSQGQGCDLSDYDGLLVELRGGDEKRYTIILKDTIADKDPVSGRDQSVISYEVDIQARSSSNKSNDNNNKDNASDAPPAYTAHVAPISATLRTPHVTLHYLPWRSFTPVYRGRPRPDAKPLDTARLQALSIMCRSHFAEQEGPFELFLGRIAAFVKESADADGDKGVVDDDAKEQGKGWWKSCFAGIEGA